MTPADCVSGNAISSMGIFAPPAVENTPVPASQPSSRVYQEIVHVSVNTLPEFTSVSAVCSLTVTPYARVGHERNWLTLYQLVTPKNHRDYSSDLGRV